jgi:hypothetical protein
MAMAGDLICWSGGVNAPRDRLNPALTMKFKPGGNHQNQPGVNHKN